VPVLLNILLVMEPFNNNIVYIVFEKTDLLIHFKPEDSNMNVIGVYENKFDAEKACFEGNRIIIGPVPFYKNDMFFPKLNNKSIHLFDVESNNEIFKPIITPQFIESPVHPYKPINLFDTKQPKK